MLIFEELSIPKEVENESEQIKTLIYNTLPNCKEQSSFLNYDNYTLVKTNEIELPNNSLIKTVVDKIVYAVIYFANKELYSNYFWNFNFGGEFNKETKTIELTIFAIGDEVNEKFLNNVLFHEIHHAYQLTLYGEARHSLSKLYRLSLMILNNPYASRIETDIAKMIYFLGQKEIDANMQSLFQELKKSEDGFTNILKQFEDIKTTFSAFQEYVYDDKVKDICYRTFEISLDGLLNYLDKGIKYFESKKRKVLMKFKMEKDKVTEVSRKFNKFII